MSDTSRRTLSRTLAVLTAVALVAGAALVFTIPRGANAANFTDTPPWAAKQINWLADNGIAGGYPDNTFRPDLNITRAQAAYWFGNYNDTIELVTEENDPVPGATFTETANCPAGKRAVAGGGRTSTTNIFITDSYPNNPSSWFVRWETENDTSLNPTYVRAWALCIPNAL